MTNRRCRKRRNRENQSGIKEMTTLLPATPAQPERQSSAPGSAPASEDLDRVLKGLEVQTKQHELEAKKQELEAKKQEWTRNAHWFARWNNPLVVAGFVALFGILGTLITWSLAQSDERTRQQRTLELEETKQRATEKLEQLKREGALIVDAIKTGGGRDREKQAAANLVFLADAGLISSLEKERVEKLRKIAGSTLPALPASSSGSDSLNRGEFQRVNMPSAFPSECSLEITTATGVRSAATGTLIAPRVVLTSAHSLYMPNLGGWVKSVAVAPGRNGDSKPFGQIEATEFRCTKQWTESQQKDNDYGVIILPKEFAGVRYRSPQMLPDNDFERLLIGITGYALDKDIGAMWSDVGYVDAVRGNVIFYSTSTSHGMSGAPIEVMAGGLHQAKLVAIHTHSGSANGNEGIRFTQKVLSDLQHWISESESLKK